MDLQLTDIYEVIQSNVDFHFFEDVIYYWKQEIIVKAKNGNLSFEEIMDCYGTVKNLHECGGMISMLWSEEQLNFPNMNQAIIFMNKYLYKNSNNSLPVFFTPFSIEFDIDYSNEINYNVEKNFSKIGAISKINNEKFFENLHLNLLMFLGRNDIYENGIYNNLSYEEKKKYAYETSFQYVKFGKYYIFMLFCEV